MLVHPSRSGLYILGTIAMAEKRPADALKEYQKVDLAAHRLPLLPCGCHRQGL